MIMHNSYTTYESNLRNIILHAKIVNNLRMAGMIINHQHKRLDP